MGLLGIGCQIGPQADDHPEPGEASAPIVNGTETVGYLGVPQIRTTFSDGTGGNCTGTLLSYRVVLTAAHCVDPDPGLSVEGIEARFGPISESEGAFLEVIPVEDYYWDSTWNFSGDDIALLLLEADSSVEPYPYNTVSLTGADLGRDLTMVGWGITDDGRQDDGTKRVATGPLVSFDNSKVFRYGDPQGATCNGDSGGPEFLDGEVVGITSFHSGGCGAFEGASGATRVAAYKNLIADFIADNDVAQSPVVNITDPTDGDKTRDGFPIRVDATDDSRIERVEIYVNGELSAESTSAPYGDFGEGLALGMTTIEARAFDNRGAMTSASVTVEVVPGVAVGGACEGNGQCESDLCATLGNESLCTQACMIDDECPDGMECIEEGGACWPKSDDGGCQASGNGGASSLLALGFIAAALVRRRRR